MRKVTFKELYAAESAKRAPLKLFREECAKVTGMSEFTIRQWGCGIQKPNKSARLLLGRHFGCDPDSLFPDDEETEENKK